MEDTYKTKAIVLKRTPYKEDDLLVSILTEKSGKLRLTSRGAFKKGAKLAGHLEPLTISDFMIVRGKKMNYIGAAKGENFYINIKEDLAKTKYAGLALRLIDKYIKEEDVNENIYSLLEAYLDILNKTESKPDYDLFYIAFVFKFLALLGLCPNFNGCTKCRNNSFDSAYLFNSGSGGLVCRKCEGEGINITGDSIKVVRFIEKNKLSEIKKLKIEPAKVKEIMKCIGDFCSYNL